MKKTLLVKSLMGGVVRVGVGGSCGPRLRENSRIWGFWGWGLRFFGSKLRFFGGGGNVGKVYRRRVGRGGICRAGAGLGG